MVFWGLPTALLCLRTAARTTRISILPLVFLYVIKRAQRSLHVFNFPRTSSRTISIVHRVIMNIFSDDVSTGVDLYGV